MDKSVSFARQCDSHLLARQLGNWFNIYNWHSDQLIAAAVPSSAYSRQGFIQATLRPLSLNRTEIRSASKVCLT